MGIGIVNCISSERQSATNSQLGCSPLNIQAKLRSVCINRVSEETHGAREVEHVLLAVGAGLRYVETVRYLGVSTGAGGPSSGLDDLGGKRDALLVAAVESGRRSRENLRGGRTLRVDGRERRACSCHSRSRGSTVADRVRQVTEANVMINARVCLHVVVEIVVDVGDRAGGSRDKTASSALRRWGKKTGALSLDASVLEFGSTEAASGRSLLLEHLLLMSVGVADLDGVLFAAGLGDRGVVEALDDFLADLAGFEAARVSLMSDEDGIHTERSRLRGHCHGHHAGCEPSTP
jgi:hypothetical protein